MSTNHLEKWNRVIRLRIQQAPVLDLEQGLLRLGLGTIVIVYLVISGAFETGSTDNSTLSTLMGVAYAILALSVFISILTYPVASKSRRLFGMVVDLSFCSYIMYQSGPTGAPLFFVYYWVTVGNGFRWGTFYLYAAMMVSLVGFSFVFLFADYWYTKPTIAFGVLLTLVVVPLFVSKLIRRLNEALAHAKKANEAKTSFLANMSHEIRTPLNGVIGMTDLLVGTRLNREQKDFVQTIQASANALLSLVEDILDISKIEVGKLTIEKQECDLPMLVNSTVKMLKAQATDKGLYLRVDISQNVPIVVISDPQLLRQVLINLIGNSIKFTEEGGIEVRVARFEEKSNNKISVRFEVIDTGVGIPTEVQDKIFDTFTQADESVTRRYGGTGLGTAISKQLIELLGGEIKLQSSPGQGSRFWFALDFDLPTADSENISAKGLSAKKLLILQSRENQSGLHDVVSPWVKETQTANSEHQALKLLKGAVLDKESFDLVLVSEYQLGVVRFAELVKGDQELKDTELVLVASTQESGRIEDYIQAGYRDVLSMPVDIALMFNTLHNAVTEAIQEIPEVSRLADYFPIASKVGGLDILVAEDNPINQKVVSKILERAGHQVDLVANGQLALEKLEHKDYDLTVLDMQMPVMGGVDAIKMFRFAHVDSNMPFIMLTANATVQAVKECEDIGVDAFVTKPFQARKLIDTIDQVAGQYKIVPSVVEKLPVESVEKEKPSTDLTKLAELASLSHDSRFLEELVFSFLQDGAKLIGEMKDAFGHGEILRMKEVAHAFKGSAASLGATRLYETGIKLGDLSVAGFREKGEVLLDQAENEFSLVSEELRTYLEQHRSEALH